MIKEYNFNNLVVSILQLGFCFLCQATLAQSIQASQADYDRVIFAGGCFWHLDSAFTKVKGVISTQVGFTGGQTPFPQYRQVASGTSGHVEAIQVVFDTKQVSYTELIVYFLDFHNPTYPYRQTPGPGAQYQSIIFYRDSTHYKIAKEILQKVQKSGKYTISIQTKVQKASPFYPAEAYHQKYFDKKHQRCPAINSGN